MTTKIRVSQVNTGKTMEYEFKEGVTFEQFTDDDFK